MNYDNALKTIGVKSGWGNPDAPTVELVAYGLFGGSDDPIDTLLDNIERELSLCQYDAARAAIRWREGQLVRHVRRSQRALACRAPAS